MAVDLDQVGGKLTASTLVQVPFWDFFCLFDFWLMESDVCWRQVVVCSFVYGGGDNSKAKTAMEPPSGDEKTAMYHM